MHPSPRNETDDTAPIVRGRRVLGALLVALELCTAAVVVCWLVLLPGSSPQRALERTVNQMVWIWPSLMIFGLPPVLLYFEKKRQA